MYHETYLVDLMIQAIREKRATKEEIYSYMLGNKDPDALSESERSSLFFCLKKLFGNIYTLFQTHGVFHIAGGENPTAAANYLLTERGIQSAWFNGELPLLMNGGATASTLLQRSKELKQKFQYNPLLNLLFVDREIDDLREGVISLDKLAPVTFKLKCVSNYSGYLSEGRANIVSPPDPSISRDAGGIEYASWVLKPEKPTPVKTEIQHALQRTWQFPHQG